MTLTFDPKNLFRNAYSHGEYVCQVSLKSLHYVQRYCLMQNVLIDG